MLWLYILLGILLVIFLLLLTPVKLKASYNEDFRCILKIGFVKFSLYPPKPKKKKKKPKKADEEQKSEETKKESRIKEKGISWLFDLIKKIADLAVGALKDFFRHIIVKKLLLSISIAGSDAADTAVKYGYCCSAVYPAFGIIVGAVNCKKYGVDISPDFEEKAKSAVNMELESRIKILWLLALVIKHGIKGLKLLI
ncbi:MAG: DUF2953 domain-containing protein, partial [Ruminococcus sp.]|nr:DUF2953 domain-containing protein [Ruminococcus sp.]